jgi:hypothetical protein
MNAELRVEKCVYSTVETNFALLSTEKLRNLLVEEND